MPPRPVGTDGRDHSYREVIADRYKRMANYKDSIEKLMFLHIMVLLVKLAWTYAADAVGGTGLPRSLQGMVAGEGAVLLMYNWAKLGTVKESLKLLKVFNILQALVAATQVLNSWQYHMGTNTQGVAMYEYSAAITKFVSAKYPAYNRERLSHSLKTFELFLDLTLAAFLAMGVFVSHKMIVEKMDMKKEKKYVKTDRKDAQKGGSDDSDSSDEDSDADAAPQAVPLQQEEKPKVARSAAASKTAAARRRHA